MKHALLIGFLFFAALLVVSPTPALSEDIFEPRSDPDVVIVDLKREEFSSIYNYVSSFDCISCSLVTAFAVMGDTYAKAIFSGIAPFMQTLLVLFFLLYFFFQAMKLFVPIGEGDGSISLQRIGTGLIFFVFAFAALSRDHQNLFFDYIYNPLLAFGVTAGANAFIGAMGMCNDPLITIYTPDTIPMERYDVTVPLVLSEGMTLSPIDRDAILKPLNCLMANTQSVASLGIAIGIYSMFNADTNFLVAILTGVVIIVLFAYLFIAAGFMILDVLFRTFLIVAAAPIFIVGAVFPIVRQWFKIAVQGIMQSALTLFFAGILYGLAASLICNIPRMFGASGVSDIVDLFRNGDVTMSLVDPFFWVLVASGLLSVQALRKAGALASAFSSSAFVGASDIGTRAEKAGVTVVNTPAAAASYGYERFKIIREDKKKIVREDAAADRALVRRFGQSPGSKS